MQKLITIILIFLFISLSVSASITADKEVDLNIKSNQIDSDNCVEFIVTEFKANSSISTTKYEFPRDQAREILEEIATTTDANETLTIYKKHGIIKQYVTLEKLQTGMFEKAKKMNLTYDRLEEFSNKIFLDKTIIGRKSFKNFFCRIYTPYLYGIFNILIGLSLITNILNNYLHNQNKLLLPSIDLINVILSLGGSVIVGKGLFPDDYAIGLFLRFMMIGFVGIIISNNAGLTYFLPVKYSEQIIGFTAFACGTAHSFIPSPQWFF